jgi:cell division protein FtsX
MFKLNFKTFVILSTILAVFVSTLIAGYVTYSIRTAATDADKKAQNIWTDYGTYLYVSLGSGGLAIIAGTLALFIV